jgi:hypothetical protein
MAGKAACVELNLKEIGAGSVILMFPHWRWPRFE